MIYTLKDDARMRSQWHEKNKPMLKLKCDILGS